MDVAQWTNSYRIHDWRIIWSSYRKLEQVRFESKTTKFRSHPRTDWAIRSWVQVTLFHGHWWLTGYQGKVGDHFMLQSTTSTSSQVFRHLFATLHVRWLSHIFNRTVCIYQAATWWDSPSYQITIWLIDDVKLIFVCLLFVLILGFCYSYLTRETSGLELISAIILALQVNQLIKPLKKINKNDYLK